MFCFKRRELENFVNFTTLTITYEVNVEKSTCHTNIRNLCLDPRNHIELYSVLWYQSAVLSLGGDKGRWIQGAYGQSASLITSSLGSV